MSIAATPHILGTAETRKMLPAILDRFRRQGADAEPVFIGSYRHADAVLIPVALAEKLAPVIEDLLIAERNIQRLNEPHETIHGDELVERLGLERVDLESDRAEVLMHLGPEKES